MIQELFVFARSILGRTLLLALSLACGAVGIVQARAADKLIPITIGYQVDAEAAFFLAKDTGAFQKAGLDPTFTEFLSGPAQFAALANNSIDIGEFGITPYVAGFANSGKMVAIMVGDDVTKSNGLVVRPGSGISSIADLRGKRVAVVKGSSSYYGLLKALQQNHMTLGDIKYLNLTAAVIIPSYQHGEVDAVWIWAPWVGKLESMGAKLLVTNGDVGAITPSFWAANRKWLAAHNQAAALFVKVFSDETKLINQDKTVARKPIQDVMGVSEDAAMKILSNERYSTIEQLMDPNYPLTMVDFASGKQGVGKAMKDMAEFEKANAMIKSVPPLSTTFDFGPIKAALAMH